ALRSEQQIKRLGCGHQNMRRTLEHGGPLARRSIARANCGADLWSGQAVGNGQRRNLCQRILQVPLDVVAESLERRDIDHWRGICQRASEPLAPQAVKTN